MLLLLLLRIKLPGVSDFVKKADYDAEIKEVKDKYFSTSDCNNFTNNTLDAKITAKKLVNESGLNEKIKKNSNQGRIKGRAR